MLFLNYIPDLNEIETHIYHYVANNIDKIQYLTIREIAELNHVSTTTIWRFCKKFECDGYSEFKSRLKQYVLEKQGDIEYHSLDEDSLINFLKGTKNEVFENKIQEAAEIIASKEIIYFAGYGTSDLTAQYGSMYFHKLSSLAVNLKYLVKYPSYTLTPETASKMCLIALSVSGENNRVLANVSHFSKNGVKVISITNSEKCRLSTFSTVTIPYYTKAEKILTADITTQIPAIFILERIAKEVANIKNIRTLHSTDSNNGGVDNSWFD